MVDSETRVTVRQDDISLDRPRGPVANHGHPRILHVVRRLDCGGLQVGVVNLVCGLERLGLDQAVRCLEGGGTLADGLPESVPVWSCAEGERPQRLPRRAARYFRAWRPDVLHARNGGAWIDTTAAWL